MRCRNAPTPSVAASKQVSGPGFSLTYDSHIGHRLVVCSSASAEGFSLHGRDESEAEWETTSVARWSGSGGIVFVQIL